MMLKRKIAALAAILALAVTSILPGFNTSRATGFIQTIAAMGATPAAATPAVKPAVPAAPQHSTAPLSVKLSMPDGAIIKPDEPLSLQATLTNSSDFPIALESAEITSSRTILTTSTALYSWLNGTLSEIPLVSLSPDPSLSSSPASSAPATRSSETPSDTAAHSPSESTHPLHFPTHIEAHQTASFSLSLSPEDRGWYTERFFWGARGLSIHVTGSPQNTEQENLTNQSNTQSVEKAQGTHHAQTSDVEAYDRSVIVSIPDDELPRFPIAAAVVCKADSQQFSALTSPLDTLIGLEDSSAAPESEEKTAKKTHNAPAQPSNHAAANSDSPKQTTQIDAIAPIWDTAGINLFLDPILAAESHTLAATAAASTDSASALSTLPLPNLSSASLYSLPAYNADLHALAHSTSTNVKDEIISAGSEARAAAPHFSDTLYTPILDSPDTALLALIAQSQLGTPILPSNSLQYQDSYFFPDALGTVATSTVTPNAQTDAPAQEPANPSAMPAVMANSVLSSILEGTFTLEHSDESLSLSDEKIASTALAYSTILYNQAPSYKRSTVVLFSTDCSDTNTAHSVSSLLAAPWLTPVSLENLTPPAEESQMLEEFDKPYVWEIKTDSGDNADNAAQPSSEHHLTPQDIETIAAFLRDKEELAKALPSDSDFSSQAEHYAYNLLNQSWQTDSDERQRRIAELDISAFISKHLHIQEASKITIISESSHLPLRIHSDLNVPVTVTPEISVPDSRLSIDNLAAVTLKPRTTTTASIPVTAQGSGYISANTAVKIPNSVLSSASIQLHIRLHAGWETIGTAIIASLIGIILLVGIIRAVRAGRRSQPISNDQFTEGLRSTITYQNRHNKT